MPDSQPHPRPTGFERRRSVKHSPNIAVPEATWDDIVHFLEMTSYPDSDRLVDAMREGQALVTAEFMRDAIDAFDVVEHILDQESRER